MGSEDQEAVMSALKRVRAASAFSFIATVPAWLIMSENVFGFLLMKSAVSRRANADSVCVRFESDPSVSTCGNVISSCVLLVVVLRS